MLVLYSSLTGNVKRFVGKLPFEARDLRQIESINRPYVLVTYTFNFGQVPVEVMSFLEKNNNHLYLKGVASSGNRNWGNFFGRAGDIISQKYNVPLICKFELAGTQQDVEKFIERVECL